MNPLDKDEQAEIDLPFGVKFKGAVTKQVMPYAGWLVAVGVAFYVMNGPALSSLRNLEERAGRIEASLAEVKTISTRNKEDIGEIRRDIRGLYQIQSQKVPDHRGTEISAVSRRERVSRD